MENDNPGTFARPIRPQLFITFVFSLIAAAFGMSVAHTAVLLPRLLSGNSSVTIDDDMGSWIASGYVIVAPAGCIIGGLAMDIWGRRKILIAGCFFYFSGCLLISIAQNGGMILMGRMLEGVSRSATVTGKTVLIDELADPRFRGFMMYVLFTSFSVGMIAISSLGTYLHWRTASGLAAGLSLLTLILSFFVSESPIWLVRMNRKQKAEKALKWLWGSKKPQEAEAELADLTERLCPQGDITHSKKTWNLLRILRQFTESRSLKPFLIIHFFNLIQVFCGLNLLTYYTVDILSRTKKPGIKVFDEFKSTVLISTLRTFFTLIACFLTFSIGRRTMALTSGTLSAVAAIIAGVMLLPQWENSYLMSEAVDAHIIFISIIIYALSMSVGFLIIPLVMIGETQPSNIRALACGYIYTTNDLALGGVLKVYPWLVSNLNMHGLFFMFGVSCIVCTVFVYFFVPETRGLTLLEIEDYFKEPNIMWITRKKKQKCTNVN